MASREKAQPIGHCKLCGIKSVLKVSHIMPNWTYRRVTREGDPNPVMIDGDVARRGGKQLKSHLLCEPCEQHLGKLDAYASEVSVQLDGRFPLLEGTVPNLERTDVSVSHIPDNDATKLAAFGISLIWRASVSRLFPEVQLGERYEATIASWLQDWRGSPIANVVVLLELLRVDESLPLNRMCLAPVRSSTRPSHGYRFVCWGMAFHIFVGRAVPPEIEQLGLSRHGVALVSDGAQMAASLGPTFERIRVNGGLRGRPKRR